MECDDSSRRGAGAKSPDFALQSKDFVVSDSKGETTEQVRDSVSRPQTGMGFLGMNSPAPTWPTNSPSRTTILPLDMTVVG